ncbi:MAG: hypothetical protein K0B37_03680 [Bacteroidales bacterium]|nr:hypothetical protein [Bacteroidales bacterium]
MQRIIFTLLFILFSFLYLQAQTHEDFYTRSLDINKSGMYFLGGWALANMATGTYGWIRYDGEKKYFHQMNAAWNVVNAGIAIYALFDIAGTDISMLGADEMMRKHIRSENLFLINAGLDILYMAGGAWLIHAAGKNEKRHDMFKGYGQSVILQGAFLFLFDLVKFGIQYNHRMNFTETSTNLGLTGNGITLSIGF